MAIHLVVTHPFVRPNPFRVHQVGTHITDPAEVATILASEHEGHVVKIVGPDAPPPAPAPEHHPDDADEPK